MNSSDFAMAKPHAWSMLSSGAIESSSGLVTTSTRTISYSGNPTSYCSSLTMPSGPFVAKVKDERHLEGDSRAQIAQQHQAPHRSWR